MREKEKAEINMQKIEEEKLRRAWHLVGAVVVGWGGIRGCWWVVALQIGKTQKD